jgi:hypothetical protein
MRRVSRTYISELHQFFQTICDSPDLLIDAEIPVKVELVPLGVARWSATVGLGA